MTALLRRRDERDRGFTLTELLVVIVIIGILAAIAIPLYINQQARARDAAAQSDVTGIGREIQAQLVNIGVGDIRVGMNTNRTNYTLSTDGGTTREYLGGVSSTVTLLNESGAPAVTNPMTYIRLVVHQPPDPDNPVAGTPDLTEQNWCVHVRTDSGHVGDWRYSAQGGMEEGLCGVYPAATPTP